MLCVLVFFLHFSFVTFLFLLSKSLQDFISFFGLIFITYMLEKRNKVTAF